DAVALTVNSSRSSKQFPAPIPRSSHVRCYCPGLLLPRIDHRAVLIVLDDAHDRALRIEPGALAVLEAPRCAFGADRADEVGGRGHCRADLILVERTGLADRLRDQMDAIPAIGRQA